ncbi:NUDIX domain-containing protein [Pontixanthobacter aquaemixtae]|uniref:NUDIX domain-containing protein n=1 Tax=Pontixanthobacter aquaemixtae TaxID=1958940 RepID=A0A844ZYR0_9SPHN|nr:NUDIX domain-containing protein [Pontixanthobacter aquaemixtae]MXO91877.1 NUDIX domain-containing protein [Pontixanthobacter aquaemixtae]
MLRLIPAPLHRLLYKTADFLRSLWWQIARPQIEGAAVVATDAQGRLLLIRLSYGSGGWNIPTGGVNRAEEPVDAARRELREETGCEAETIVPLGVQHTIIHGARNRVHVFAAKVSGPPAADMREVIEARMFAMDSLPEPLTKTTQRRLDLYRSVSEQR